MSEQHKTSAIVAKRPPETGHEDGVAVDGSLNAGPLGNWRIRAAGLYAGTIVVAAVFGGILVKGESQTNPQHFILAIVSAGVLGGLLHAMATRAHIRALSERIQDFRTECHRMAERNKDLEKRALSMRLSSVSKKIRKRG